MKKFIGFLIMMTPVWIILVGSVIQHGWIALFKLLGAVCFIVLTTLVGGKLFDE